ncbi:hypothetical protein ACFL7M_15380 [Thermodesulfobacteriota bacterium]
MSDKGALQRLHDCVIGKDLCALCGACASMCPYLRSFEGRIVNLNQCDLSEGRCYEYCPNGFQRSHHVIQKEIIYGIPSTQ